MRAGHRPATLLVRARSIAAGRHGQSEHPVGINAGIERAGIEEVLPLRSVAWKVELQQSLPELRRFVPIDVEDNHATVDSDRQLLARQVSRTDLWSIFDVTKADRVR